VLAALASPPATKALDPDPFPCRSLRHAVYAALLLFLEAWFRESRASLELQVGGVAYRCPIAFRHQVGTLGRPGGRTFSL